MTYLLRSIALTLGLPALLANLAVAQEVHEIRMVEKGKGEFRFEPASVTARRGDVLLFRVVSGGPHSVVFEGKGLPPAVREQLNQALPRRAGDLSSPLLTADAEYRVVVPGVPPGTYRYFCLPHKAYDERGEVTVK